MQPFLSFIGLADAKLHANEHRFIMKDSFINLQST